MTAVLLANVGNSDLTVDTALLPARDFPPCRRWPTRELGEEILRDYARYEKTIQLPLLGAALDTVRGWNDPDLRVVLFASDQNPDYVERSEYLKDSAPSAKVIERFLKNGPNPPKSIRVHLMVGNPADYANALDFLRSRLRDLARSLPAGARIAAEVSGGTPAMTAMLIVQSVEVFGQEVTVLYVDRGSESAREVDVARSLFARKTKDSLRAQLSVHAYAAALQLVDDSGHLLVTDENRRSLLRRLVAYADRRLAFDFKRARQELRQARSVGDLQARIAHWQRELIDGNRQKNLEELIFSAAIKLHQGEYAEFTQRLFLFQETIFRAMVERLGHVEYEDKKEQRLASAWMSAQPDFAEFARDYRRMPNGRLSSKPAQEGGVRYDSTLNRYSLGALVEYLLSRSPHDELREAADQVFRFSLVADLRNKSPAGHGFLGIGDEDIELAYGEPSGVLVQSLRRIYQVVFACPPDDDPYSDINAVILSLIEDSP